MMTCRDLNAGEAGAKRRKSLVNVVVRVQATLTAPASSTGTGLTSTHVMFYNISPEDNKVSRKE
jgi:hypothetical protein